MLTALTNRPCFKISQGQGLGWCCLFSASLRYSSRFSLKFFFNHPLTSYHWTLALENKNSRALRGTAAMYAFPQALR